MLKGETLPRPCSDARLSRVSAALKAAEKQFRTVTGHVREL